MDINDIKIRTIQDSVCKCQEFVDDLCNIRPDIYNVRCPAWTETIGNIKKDIEREQMLLFTGPYSSGKSTFINALLGENILPTASQACTSVITELTFVADNMGSRGKIYFKNGESEDGLYDHLIKIIDGPTGAIGRVAQIDHVELIYDLESLRQGPSGYDWEKYPTLVAFEKLKVKLVDCPGFGSPYCTNESLISEYVSRASFTFWFSPADKLGGQQAERTLSKIKKRTATLIPVITMSDKVNDQQKEQVIDDFQEHLGSLFQYKEPRFISSYKYQEAMDLQKSLEQKKDLSKEEKRDMQDKIAKNINASGMEKVAEDLIDAGGRKTVTDSKVTSARFSLKELLDIIRKAAKQEEANWQEVLTKEGWSESDEYLKLNEVKAANIRWINQEAKQIGGELETALLASISSYMMKVRKNIKADEVMRIVSDSQKEIVDPKINEWGEHLLKTYSLQGQESVDIKAMSITAPSGVTIKDNIRNSVMGILDSIKYASVTTVVTGGIGLALATCNGINLGITTIGAGVVGTIGCGLMAVAIIPLLPAINNAIKAQNEENKRKVETELRVWLQKLNLAPMIEKELLHENQLLFDNAKQNMSLNIKQPLKNYEKAKSIEIETQELEARIRQQFDGVK